MSFSRREFMQAAMASAALVGGGAGSLGRAAAQGKLTQENC